MPIKDKKKRQVYMRTYQAGQREQLRNLRKAVENISATELKKLGIQLPRKRRKK